MGAQSSSRDISSLVDNMFRDVFTPDERRALLERITAWEAQNPGLSAGDRVTGWIDIAYEFQARQQPETERTYASAAVARAT